MSLFERDRCAERLPVSVVTGFLGSGKTTVLRHLLRQPGRGDSAVIVNELGEVGLGHLLLERVDGETALLASGCVCCARSAATSRRPCARCSGGRAAARSRPSAACWSRPPASPTRRRSASCS